jgi:hypothetical protein
MTNKFLILIFLYSIASFTQVNAINIISREEWGADENYTYLDSQYWKDILKARAESAKKNTGNIPSAAQVKAREDLKKANDYVNLYFPENYKVSEVIPKDTSGNTLAWKLQYSDTIRAIIVHHSASEYPNSLKGVQDIYRYHSIQRQWGDIWYHYVIGYNWEIFEGKKWWKYVVGAHSRWNNIGTIGIVVMGDYEEKDISEKQYLSLKLLISQLSYDYGLDLNSEYYYNRDCVWNECLRFPLITEKHFALSGHKDTGNTSCPGEKLHEKIEQIREELSDQTRDYIPVKRWEIASGVKKVDKTLGQLIQVLKKYPPQVLENALIIISKLEQSEDIQNSQAKKEMLQKIKIAILSILD